MDQENATFGRVIGEMAQEHAAAAAEFGVDPVQAAASAVAAAVILAGYRHPEWLRAWANRFVDAPPGLYSTADMLVKLTPIGGLVPE